MRSLFSWVLSEADALREAQEQSYQQRQKARADELDALVAEIPPSGHARRKLGIKWADYKPLLTEMYNDGYSYHSIAHRLTELMGCDVDSWTVAAKLEYFGINKGAQKGNPTKRGRGKK